MDDTGDAKFRCPMLPKIRKKALLKLFPLAYQSTYPVQWLYASDRGARTQGDLILKFCIARELDSTVSECFST